MPLHPPERRPCPVRKPPGHRSECRCAKFTPVGPDVFAVRHRGGEDRPARDECRRPSLSPRRTADRTGATTKMRRGREAKCRASYPHRPAERGCKRMSEGNGRVPLRRTAGRSFLRGEAPRRDGRTRQLRPGIAKGEPAGRGDKSFGEAVLAAHGRAELPPRRSPEKGRADLTAAARDREGRSRRQGAIRVSTRPSAAGKATADRTGATTKTRRGGEAGRRSAELPIRTGRPNAVASGCRKETAAFPCGARPGGASSEARPREGTGGPDSCGPGSRRAKPSAAEKATADRTGATTKTRRGGEAKCRASYSHRPAERGCKRMPEGNGRVPLRRTAGRSFLRGEAPRRDGQTWQLRPGTAKGAAGGEGDKSFGEAVLAARSRAELPPRRDPEKGRADSTNTVRNRTG
ncbi:hypothetical protein BN3659_01113 [Alistipes sp. CHKCI003]|nr:hypothetical protein BN3659_01113 [Alistipes sp. CHKCI003]